MGVFKELVIDHSLDGRQLPKNIVVIAACNPARDKIERMADRREELGNEWVIGHYQVHPLPASMQQMTWDFGALKPAQEEEFIRKKLNFLIQAEAHEDPTERSSDFAAHQVRTKCGLESTSVSGHLTMHRELLCAYKPRTFLCTHMPNDALCRWRCCQISCMFRSK